MTRPCIALSLRSCSNVRPYVFSVMLTNPIGTMAAMANGSDGLAAAANVTAANTRHVVTIARKDGAAREALVRAPSTAPRPSIAINVP
jgi:DNA-binding phage protein